MCFAKQQCLYTNVFTLINMEVNNMDIKNIKTKIPLNKKKDIPINIRIDKDVSDWLKEKEYSPTGIFNEAIKDLGYKNE